MKKKAWVNIGGWKKVIFEKKYKIEGECWADFNYKQNGIHVFDSCLCSEIVFNKPEELKKRIPWRSIAKVLLASYMVLPFVLLLELYMGSVTGDPTVFQMLMASALMHYPLILTLVLLFFYNKTKELDKKIKSLESEKEENL